MEFNEKFDFSGRVYFSYLLDAVVSARQTKYDVILNIDDNKIHCHKSILCHESEFFLLMFTTDMMEKKQETISLKGISYEATKSVIGFLYTCELVVPPNEMCEIVRLVDMFQIHILRPVCAEILLNSCTVSNLISINCLAAQYRYHDVADEAFSLILQDFTELIRQPEFLEASFELVLSIFTAECLCHSSENECIRAILNWIQYDVNTRHVHLVDLLEHVLPFEISCWNELEARAYMLEAHGDSLDVFNNWIARGRKHSNEFRSEQIRKRGNRLQKVCVAVGGLEGKHMEVKVPRGADWGPYINYLHTASVPAEVMLHPHKWPAYASRQRLLYVIGGRLYVEGEPYIVEVFDIMKNTWTELPHLPTAVDCAAAVCVDHRIYLTGGYKAHRSDLQVTDKVWFLDTDGQGNVVGNEWKEGPAMSVGRASHALININGILFAIGGVDAATEATNHVECLLPGNNQWMPMPGLLEKRAHFACVAFQKKIYVMGGERKVPSTDTNSSGNIYWEHMHTVEMFDTESSSDSWQYRSRMRPGQTRSAATVIDNRIYVAGGLNDSGRLGLAQMYNPATNNWHAITSMKFNRSHLGLATLNLY
ncbi:kelch-like protein 28 [Nilaparvata lugens]|uniref:kelch-like protein 28 n=1 Tax=Nilaparvata lugens TaxID=108931 RepID=UPI00193EA106|nr:kelch-like protein 28 [Nilaparvata lugens]